MNDESFQALLGALSDDRDRAGVRYEELRMSLIRYFRFKGSHDPEESADEVMRRVADKVGGGSVRLDPASPDGYFFKVASYVAKEQWAGAKRRPSSLADLPPHRQPAIDPAEERLAASERAESDLRAECLDACLSRLPAGQRDFIVSYYEGRGRAKIESRGGLADKLGLSANALRIRVSRAKSSLETCVFDCVASGTRAALGGDS